MNAQDKIANIIGQMTLRIIELEVQVEGFREENDRLRSAAGINVENKNAPD